MIVIAIVAVIFIVCIIITYFWYYGYFEKEELMMSSEFYVVGKKTILHDFKGFKVWEIYDALDKEECQALIDKAESSKHNVSDEHMLSRVESETLRTIVSSLMGIPPETKQSFGVYKYFPGVAVPNHYDGCKKNVSDDCAKRAISNLLYLNDDFEGGEIHFTELGLTIEPATGKLVLFKNYNEKGDGFEYSVHQGLPVTNGMKYLLV